jgi:hypothetical protein
MPCAWTLTPAATDATINAPTAVQRRTRDVPCAGAIAAVMSCIAISVESGRSPMTRWCVEPVKTDWLGGKDV